MARGKKYRRVVSYQGYFEKFLSGLPVNVKEKIIWTLMLIEELERVPEKYLKHLSGTNGLYEVRVRVGTEIFRIFCFFDKDTLVVLMNGFQKRSQKVPRREIEKALLIKKAYEKERR